MLGWVPAGFALLRNAAGMTRMRELRGVGVHLSPAATQPFTDFTYKSGNKSGSKSRQECQMTALFGSGRRRLYGLFFALSFSYWWVLNYHGYSVVRFMNAETSATSAFVIMIAAWEGLLTIPWLLGARKHIHFCGPLAGVSLGIPAYAYIMAGHRTDPSFCNPVYELRPAGHYEPTPCSEAMVRAFELAQYQCLAAALLFAVIGYFAATAWAAATTRSATAPNS